MVGGQLCDMAYIVPMHIEPKFTYLEHLYEGLIMEDGMAIRDVGRSS